MRVCVRDIVGKWEGALSTRGVGRDAAGVWGWGVGEGVNTVYTPHDREFAVFGMSATYNGCSYYAQCKATISSVDTNVTRLKH